ncbi:mycofactocin biosynthesis glycosyltransferase MftF [Desulfobacula sp.]|uniref:mycofactocin biosynthesis glycosyltransferase MftF n=1 Tax=Desulfobacula sp. TaxID=2593537 RepID=UPI0026295428|nr:mycofactocin biosynthesis glycosyltransferase MftF [Desulfobacula sp.]
MDPYLKPLAYKLPEKVSCQKNDTSLVLVRSFPLKSIRLHAAWKGAFALLSSNRFIPLEKIVSGCRAIDPESVELFLNDLVRKGFLEQEGIARMTSYPYVSVIIPVQNRPEEITACLESLARLTYPSEKIEIIVVDDASTDHTPDIIKKFNVHLIALAENKKAPFCRNLAAQKAKGDILAFIDSDCTADPLWLSELIPAFKDPSIGAVGGRVDSFFHTSPLDKYEQVKSSLMMGTHAKRSRENENFFYVPSCNLLVKRDLFLNIGGFNEALVVGEDVDLCWRLQDAGHPVEFRPIGKIFHRHRNKIRPFCRRRFEYGTSEPLLQILHQNRRKQFFLPVWGSLFWSVVLLSIVFSYLPFLFLCPLIVLAEGMTKQAQIKQGRIPVRAFDLFSAIVRSYAALFYHCCSFVSRYYLIWFVPVLLIFPWVSILFIFVHCLSGLTEYVLKKPELNIFGFLFYFSLEQISYQLGVWFGCIQHKSFRAVNPVVVSQRQTG